MCNTYKESKREIQELVTYYLLTYRPEDSYDGKNESHNASSFAYEISLMEQYTAFSKTETQNGNITD
jgi:hypothetical protein